MIEHNLQNFCIFKIINSTIHINFKFHIKKSKNMKKKKKKRYDTVDLILGAYFPHIPIDFFQVSQL